MILGIFLSKMRKVEAGEVTDFGRWTRARKRNGNMLHLFGNNFPVGTECESRRVMPVTHRLNER
jgi:hypothetical protein